MTLSGGGEARLAAMDRDRIELVATRAAAPGSPLAGRLPDGRAVRIKVRRSRRQGDEYVVAGRLLDATRELRTFLERCAGEP